MEEEAGQEKRGEEERRKWNASLLKAYIFMVHINSQEIQKFISFAGCTNNR